MKRKIFLFSFFLLTALFAKAQDPVRFTASAPSTVILDKPFQLVYSVNANGKDLRPPEIENFEVLAGPFESHSSSYQVVNGKSTSTTTAAYTYTLQAQKTGTFTIASASIIVGGQKYTSNGVSIKVLPADAAPKSQNNQPSAQGVSCENIFIKTSVSKTNVYEQEPVLITYKLYTLADVIQCANKKMPDFKGFLKQDVEQSQNKQFSYENINGKNYGSVVLYQVLLYPQQSGEIQIEKGLFEAVIRVQNRTTARSIFDDFFESYTNVSKNIVAPATKIYVNVLPANKPVSFNGAVGQFTMNSTISGTEVKSNDAVTIKITIAGSGNMKLIKTPTLKLPEGFETYDPKVTNNFKTTTNGISGSKTIEYLFIPRSAGSFEIPSAEFSYFDVRDKSYKVLRTPSYRLQVQKGEGGDNVVATNSSYASKEDVKQLGKDIRYIHTENFELRKEIKYIFGTLFSWLLFLIPLLIVFTLFIIFRKQVKDSSNLSLVKNKKANKIAQKRLKIAQKLLKEGNKDKFYEEVLKALWTYLSDKLSIPVASLTKEQVTVELTSRSVNETNINQVVHVLNTCEFARYAPSTGQQEMGNLYAETIQVISELEGKLKKI